MRSGKLDKQHIIEYEKDKPENRRKRLEDLWPLAYPLAIAIETSNDCNSKCIICPRQELTRPVGNMSIVLFNKIIDELYTQGVQLRKLFLHWMGEPLMNPRIAEMIDYSQHKQVAEIIVMGTNAIRLEGETSHDIISAGLDEIFISLDANTPQTYKKIKGNDVHFHTIEHNIREFIKLKQSMQSHKPYIRLKMLKSELNTHEIDDFIDKWQGLVDEVYVEEDLNLWNGTSQLVNSALKNDINLDENDQKNQNRYPCERLWYQLAISMDGKVVPCIADWNMSSIVGDVSNQNLFDIWNQSVLVNMRRAHLEQQFGAVKMCEKCMRWIYRRPGEWIFDKDKSLKTCTK